MISKEKDINGKVEINTLLHDKNIVNAVLSHEMSSRYNSLYYSSKEKKLYVDEDSKFTSSNEKVIYPHDWSSANLVKANWGVNLKYVNNEIADQISSLEAYNFLNGTKPGFVIKDFEDNLNFSNTITVNAYSVDYITAKNDKFPRTDSIKMNPKQFIIEGLINPICDLSSFTNLQYVVLSDCVIGELILPERTQQLSISVLSSVVEKITDLSNKENDYLPTNILYLHLDNVRKIPSDWTQAKEVSVRITNTNEDINLMFDTKGKEVSIQNSNIGIITLKHAPYLRVESSSSFTLTRGNIDRNEKDYGPISINLGHVGSNISFSDDFKSNDFSVKLTSALGNGIKIDDSLVNYTFNTNEKFMLESIKNPDEKSWTASERDFKFIEKSKTINVENMICLENCFHDKSLSRALVPVLKRDYGDSFLSKVGQKHFFEKEKLNTIIFNVPEKRDGTVFNIMENDDMNAVKRISARRLVYHPADNIGHIDLTPFESVGALYVVIPDNTDNIINVTDNVIKKDIKHKGVYLGHYPYIGFIEKNNPNAIINLSILDNSDEFIKKGYGYTFSDLKMIELGVFTDNAIPIIFDAHDDSIAINKLVYNCYKEGTYEMPNINAYCYQVNSGVPILDRNSSCYSYHINELTYFVNKSQKVENAAEFNSDIIVNPLYNHQIRIYPSLSGITLRNISCTKEKEEKVIIMATAECSEYTLTNCHNSVSISKNVLHGYDYEPEKFSDKVVYLENSTINTKASDFPEVFMVI